MNLSILLYNMKITRLVDHFPRSMLSCWNFAEIFIRFKNLDSLSRDFCAPQKRETAAEHRSQQGAVEANQPIFSPSCGEFSIILLDKSLNCKETGLLWPHLPYCCICLLIAWIVWAAFSCIETFFVILSDCYVIVTRAEWEFKDWHAVWKSTIFVQKKY